MELVPNARLRRFCYGTSIAYRKCCQQSTDDRRLFIALSVVHLCVQRDGRDVARRAAPSGLQQLRLVIIHRCNVHASSHVCLSVHGGGRWQFQRSRPLPSCYDWDNEGRIQTPSHATADIWHWCKSIFFWGGEVSVYSQHSCIQEFTPKCYRKFI